MGVKSTATITRDEAIRMIQEFADNCGGIEDSLLCRVCEAVSDAKADGEGFTNFTIMKEER